MKHNSLIKNFRMRVKAAFTLAEVKSICPCWGSPAEQERGFSRIAAFTLAEVLITLLIIGIIAAMTLPTLINKINKHIVEVKLKEDYSILQQAMQKANADVPFNSNVTEYEVQKWLNTYLLPYMKTAKICNQKIGCWHNEKTHTLSGSIAEYDNGNGVGIGGAIITVKLTNGTNLCFDSNWSWKVNSLFGISTNNMGLVIYIDTNGDSPPNTIGKDIYITVFTDDGLVPAGNDVSQATIDKNCSKNATGDNAGYYCLKKVQQNGWQISDDVWNK